MRQSRTEKLRNQLGLPARLTETPLDRLRNRILRSGTKRMVIVEGPTDQRIYQWVRIRFSTRRARVLYAGSISVLLRIYDQKTELFDDRDVAVAFMADRDLERLFRRSAWSGRESSPLSDSEVERLFCKCPQPEDIIWTEGYCIENDLYDGYVKDNFQDLLETAEVDQFKNIREAVVEWFAFEVEEFLDGRQHQTGKDLKDLVPMGETNIKADFLTYRGFEDPDPKIVEKLKDSYNLKVPGKLLFQMLARFLGDPARVRKYPGSQTYSLKQMYEMAGKNTSNTKTQRLIEAIDQELSKKERLIAARKSK